MQIYTIPPNLANPNISKTDWLGAICNHLSISILQNTSSQPA